MDIEQFIEEQDFFKRDSAEVIRTAFSDIRNDGIVSPDVALAIVSNIVSAIKDEYGE